MVDLDAVSETPAMPAIVGLSSSVAGRVEVLDLEDGLTGWAYDTAEPSRPITVELLAGDRVIATTPADRFRADLGSDRLTNFNPGFVFPGATLRAIALNQELAPETRLIIRVTGCDNPMPNSVLEELRSLRDLVDDAGLSPADTTVLELRPALNELAGDARLLRRRPLRATSDNARGVIERIMPIGHGRVAIAGWLERDVLLEQTAVLLDGEKHDSAFSLATYERPDLPRSAVGFAGVLQTSWRPRRDNPGIVLFFGQQGEFHFRPYGELRPEGLGEVESALTRCQLAAAPSRLSELRRLILTDFGWHPRNDGGSALGVALSVDRVLLVPGFGALVDGWILAGPRVVANLSLRIGTAVLEGDPASIQRSRRPDLKVVPSATARAITIAGFSGFFLGPLADDDLLDPLFRIVFEDGVTVTVPLNLATIERCDAGFDVRSLAVARPGLAFEPKFYDLAEARSRWIKREVARSVQAVIPGEGHKLVVLALPVCASDMTLALAGAERAFERLSNDMVLAVVGQPSQDRQRVMRWIAAMSNNVSEVGPRVSFSLVGNVSFALHAMGRLGRLHRAERIAFIGPHIVPTDRGWAEIVDRLNQMNACRVDVPNFLPVDRADPLSHGAAHDDGLFLWTADAVDLWCDQAFVGFDEFAPDRGLPKPDSEPGILPAQGFAYRLASDASSFLSDLDVHAQPSTQRCL